MSVQHQVQAFEELREVNIADNRWMSTPISRTPGRWLSDSSISFNDKSSNAGPPRQPRKHRRTPGQWVSDSRINPLLEPKKRNADASSHEDFRWKDTVCDEPSAFLPTKPIRRTSNDKMLVGLQEVTTSLHCCQVSVETNQSQDISGQSPNAQGVCSA